MPTVLHVLPHRGGGAETYIDILAGLDGFEHDRMALSTGRSPASAAASLPLNWPRIARAARGADLIHAHGDVTAALALPLLAVRPSVITTHGLHLLRRATGPRQSLIERSMCAVVRATACTLCTSQAERDELAALLRPDLLRRLAVVHNGVDLAPPPAAAQRAAIRAELSLAEGDVAALFLGELHERKAPLVAVAAARAAAQAGAPIVLLVAGDGPQAAAVRAQGGGAVRALGFRDDPARLLAATDVFVLPSTREGLSFAVLEAMAAGLALLVSDGAGNPEAVGDAGVVVPAGDTAAFAAALQRLACDGDERRRLGTAARERARTHFSRARMLEGVAAAYAAAID